LDLVAVLGLPLQPRAIDARPLGEVEHPGFVLRLLTGRVGGIEDLRAQAVPALELQQLLFQGVDVGTAMSSRP